MHANGPYEFSAGDVERTLAAGPELLDLLFVERSEAAARAAAPATERARHALQHLSTTDPEAALDVFWREWRSAMTTLRATGAFGRSAVATATGLFRSDGGVPKLPVRSVEVDFGGVVGDRQDERVHHGAPWQALCLWSTDAIEGLRAQGHPIAPGLAGENVSVTGLPWERVRPGVQVQLGDVLAEVSAYAIPCRKNAAWFIDGRFDAMHHRHGAISRVYATVLEPGTITVGSPVLLEPGA